MRVRSVDVATTPTETRIPFRFGIARLTAMPYLFVRVGVELEGNAKLTYGVAADGMVPRWFEKDPDAPFQKDIDRLWTVITRAGRRAIELGTCEGPFRLWKELYDDQLSWGRENGYAPLMAHFGVTLIERAVIDAVCRAADTPFHEMLATGRLTVSTDGIADPPSDRALRQVLEATPIPQIHARHTVGMADPLSAADLTDPVDDGLPETLTEDIAAYGLTHFKIKVQGKVDEDVDRLSEVAACIQPVGNYRFTLDGNEQFYDVQTFRDFWDQVRSRPNLKDFFTHLIFVEQPFNRAIALSDELGEALRQWQDAPPMIIDESDGDLDSLPRALALGYSGTSHKNCKGVFKGILNAARIADVRESRGSDSPASPDADSMGGDAIMSGEDLVNIGPVALLQDLAVAAKLGIRHVERNGHHYFRGLSMFPQELQERTVSAHSDLYAMRSSPIENPDTADSTFANLTIQGGTLSLSSINAAPFGTTVLPNEIPYVPLQDWPTPKAPVA